jgi:leukotriene-A4 hydrolase
MARLDPHSFHDSDQPAIEHLDWHARVDFDEHVLQATATLRLASETHGAIDLDTRDLVISAVTDEAGAPLPFVLEAPEPILGARLRITPEEPTRSLRITYRTSPAASALQWLEPAQTADGKHPFLFSQCQAIHARSVVPIQDTPGVRLRYTAELDVPEPLTALMAAGRGPTWVKNGRKRASFAMPQPIPPYLLALAVGDLKEWPLGTRTSVWAEPSVVERAAYEFAAVDDMLRTAEELFGGYPWERFDVLTMPPSFPYGGMENPRLVFLTPTLLAGDRSLVNVVAHELAHSWTGNLVTNANAEHFWLNEGFTVFAERRIQEVLEGAEMVALHAALGRRDLDKAIARFAGRPELTRLVTPLDGVDPDEAFSEIPYEKGYLFLRALEESVGRAKWNDFLRRYVEHFKFQSITTADFLAFVERILPGALAQVDAPAWVDGAGVPPGAPVPNSSRLDAVEAAARAGTAPDDKLAAGWSPAEWQLYLSSLPAPVEAATRDALESRWKLSESGNYEVLVTWLERRVEAGDERAWPRVEEVLSRVGRMKYLKPLYGALAKTPAGKNFARACFDKLRAGYHPIARQVIEALLTA